MQKNEENEFFKLLVLNDSKSLEEFLMKHGKAPKSVSPILFTEKTKLVEGNEKS